MANKKLELKKWIWIYWRWKGKEHKTFSKSYIQEIIGIGANRLLELTDHEFWTNYPMRVLLSDIEIYNP